MVEWRARKYHKLPGFHQRQYSVFWQKICRKEKFMPDGPLTAWLLNRNRNTTLLKQRFNAEGQAFLYRIVTIDETWVRDWTGVEITLKRVEKSNIPATQKISTYVIKGQANYDLYLWSPRNHHDRVPCGTNVTAAYYGVWMQKLLRKMHENRPDLLGDGPLILHDNAHTHLGKVVTVLLSKYEWEVLPHAP